MELILFMFGLGVVWQIFKKIGSYRLTKTLERDYYLFEHELTPMIFRAICTGNHFFEVPSFLVECVITVDKFQDTDVGLGVPILKVGRSKYCMLLDYADNKWVVVIDCLGLTVSIADAETVKDNLASL